MPMNDSQTKAPDVDDAAPAGSKPSSVNDGNEPREIGGRKGPDPVRYGDWEKNGRCIDF